MSARYRIEQCRRCPALFGRHFIVSGGVDDFMAISLSRAFEGIARREAHRLAGNDWALWEEGGRIRVQRQGSTRVTPWRSWGEVARFLAALADADRAPLVVAS